MKRKWRICILMLCLVGATHFSAFAQDDPPGGGNVDDVNPPPPPGPPGGGNVNDVSITGLLWVLAAAGAAYGIKKKK